MKRLIPSLAPIAVAVCAAAALGGCAYPYGGAPAYGYSDGYYDPYGAPAYGYAEPPVQSSLFLGFGGYSGRDYDHRHWGGWGDHGHDHDRGNGNDHRGPNGGGPHGPPPQTNNPPMNAGGNSGGMHGMRPPVQAGAPQPQGGGNRGGGGPPPARGLSRGEQWNAEGGRPH
ncbi:hypothetical protein [Paraburkholderia diazotrophica]|nr:hypothetical protein [Paraburkholderia diazotrophica]